MPGIEFVGADTGDDEWDDVLDTGPGRPVPPWVWVVAALVAVAVGLGVLVSTGSDTTPDATPTLPGPESVSESESAPAPESLGPQITSLTADRTSLYWLAGTRLYRAGPVGSPPRSTAVAPVVDDFVETELVADPDERTVWLVSRGSTDVADGAGDVQGFAATDLTRVATASAPSLIDGAAAFNGALYVLSGSRLLRVTAREHRFVTIATVGAHARGLVATADGLAFVEGATGNALGRWTPGAGVVAPVALDTTGSSLAAVGSTVFVAGTRAGRDVVDLLAPTGRVLRRTLVTGLISHFQIVAAGSRSLLLVGTGLVHGLDLSCVRPGATDQPVASTTEAVSDNVAVLRGIVFEAVGSAVREAGLQNCPG